MIVFRFFSLLLFFPSITFGLLSAEVFPWGVVFSVLFMRTCSKYMLILAGLLCISSFFVLLGLVNSGPGLETDVLRSLAAYINVILVVQTLLSINRSRVVDICLMSRKVFWVLIGLGFLQTIGFDALGTFIQLLVPRGEGSSLSEINRGVTLLASEPARAGVELTLIYLIYRLARPAKVRDIFIDLLLIMYQALVIKSASGLAFTLGAFFIVYFRMKVDVLSLSIMGGLLLLVVPVGWLIFPSVGGRAGDLLLHIGSLESFGDALFYVANESGNRLIALYSFFLSGIYNPLGFGVGSWPYSSMIALVESGIDYRDFRFFDVVSEDTLRPFRGPGVISNLLLDIGVVGVALLAYLFSRTLYSYNAFSTLSIKALWIFLFKILLFGSPGNPIVFVFFIVVFCVTSKQTSVVNKNKFRSLEWKKM